MPDYITTFTGIHFYPTDPTSETLDIRDIAHALSLNCRGNGHVHIFLSVAQHSIRCSLEAISRGYSDRIALACLLHDAGEAYLSDVPRPYKKEMPLYMVWENRILDVIFQKYLGTVPSEAELNAIKEIDDDMLYFDLRDSLLEAPDQPEPDIHISFDNCSFVPFEQVETTFLRLFQCLTENRLPLLIRRQLMSGNKPSAPRLSQLLFETELP